jgi:hypothetical protein
MKSRSLTALMFLLAGLPAGKSQCANTPGGFELTVLVDGQPRPEFSARGGVYIEALRGRDYALEIRNPLPERVAVAVSVDGLNSIDARHTDAWKARKWVLGPYETMVIPGWQVSGSSARSFVFTGEKSSYGAWLGKTENLGVLEAVFFREKSPIPMLERRRESPSSQAAPEGAPAPPAEARKDSELSDEYAATGIGGRTEHEVESVSMNLERRPEASIRIRYEFRPQLIGLGVLPRRPTPLDRREGASGFGQTYCPEPAPEW